MIIDSIETNANSSLFFRIPNIFANIPVYLKLEGLNTAGSIKFKTAINLIDGLYRDKKIVPRKSKIIESSSGNLGVALSVICKSRNLPFICVTDVNTSTNNVNLMELYGATVICVSERDSNGGYLGTRIKKIKQMLTQDSNLLWTNQYENPDNPLTHYLTTAQEIKNQFSKVDHLFIGAGTTGTLMGCAKYFKETSPKTRIIAVDAAGSVTFGGLAKKRYIPGLGTSKRPGIVDESLIDEIIIVEEADTVVTCHEILNLTGLLVGGSTGTILNAIYTKRNDFMPGDTVVAISPDFGERYLNTIYNSNWVQERIVR